MAGHNSSTEQSDPRKKDILRLQWEKRKEDIVGLYIGVKGGRSQQ